MERRDRIILQKVLSEINIAQKMMDNCSLVEFKAIPHNATRADGEKNCVLVKALFRRNTLCISRKSDETRAQFFRQTPQANCAVLP